jgi:hypothetical protein
MLCQLVLHGFLDVLDGVVQDVSRVASVVFSRRNLARVSVAGDVQRLPGCVDRVKQTTVVSVSGKVLRVSLVTFGFLGSTLVSVRAILHHLLHTLENSLQHIVRLRNRRSVSRLPASFTRLTVAIRALRGRVRSTCVSLTDDAFVAVQDFPVCGHTYLCGIRSVRCCAKGGSRGGIFFRSHQNSGVLLEAVKYARV